METLELIKPTMALIEDCLKLRDEFYTIDGSEYVTYLPRRGEGSWAFLQRMEDQEHGRNLPPWMVPQSIFWLVRDGRTIVGQSALRHHLTPALEIEGGHIGYAIRPCERRKGYGTRILTLTLEQARVCQLRRVLVTCNTENIASARIIEHNGGVFAGENTSPYSGKPVSRYWITL